jgi:histidinol-phosphate phosphatase family protein
VAVVTALAQRPRLAVAAATAWLTGTAEFAWARIAPGPRTPGEILTLASTSALIPPAATLHTLRGLACLPALLAAPRRRRPAPRLRPAAVLLDRDDTLVVNVPYNGDPDRVQPMPGARRALDRLREAGVPVAVISNQSAVGRGLITPAQLDAVNRRVEELLGPVDEWVLCTHSPEAGCACRKPAPGLVIEAARRLGVAPQECAVVGDIGSDVEAARTAGARGILVPTARTRPEEVAAAPEIAPDLPRAVELLLGGAE